MLQRLFDDLYAHYGPQHWWPGETPWEIAVGAVLTQNTNWANVERAIISLKEADALTPSAIADLPAEQLAHVIRSAGTHTVKARRLHHLAAWWQQHATQADDASIPLPQVRQSLLAVHGIGPETADSILLYAFNRLTFVVDAYTRRILLRHQLIDPAAPYTLIKERFESALPADLLLYQEYHALIVAAGKNQCRPTPLCAGCPLRAHLPTGG